MRQNQLGPVLYTAHPEEGSRLRAHDCGHVTWGLRWWDCRRKAHYSGWGPCDALRAVEVARIFELCDRAEWDRALAIYRQMTLRRSCPVTEPERLRYVWRCLDGQKYVTNGKTWRWVAK
jgi:hypothetical protein